MAQEKFLLKILSGPHRGAEVPLSSDALLLGQGETCDVVLADETLQKEHIKLQIEKDYDCRLIPIGKITFYINGNPYNEPTLLHPFQYVLIGKTLFAIGPSDQPWPDLSEENAPPIAKEKPKSEIPTEASAPEAATDQKSADSATTTTATGEKGENKADPSSPKPTDEAKQKASDSQPNVAKKQPKRSFWRLLLFFLFFLLIVSAVIGGGYGYYLHKKHEAMAKMPPPPPPVPPREIIQKGLIKLGVDKNFFEIKDEKGLLDVQAYVATNELKTKINNYLQTLTQIPIRSTRIRSQESLIASAQEIFKDLGYVLTVEPLPDPDGLLLKGYLLDINQLPVIKSRLFSDLPSLKKVETNVLSAGDANDMAYNLLEKYQLAGLIKIVPFERGLILHGNIEERDESKWKKVYKDLRKTFENLCKLIVRIAIVPAQTLKQNFFEAPIESITISEESHTAWIDLQNGQRYFESSLLPSGYLIQKIGPDGILLSKNGEVINFKTEEI